MCVFLSRSSIRINLFKLSFCIFETIYCASAKYAPKNESTFTWSVDWIISLGFTCKCFAIDVLCFKAWVGIRQLLYREPGSCLPCLTSAQVAVWLICSAFLSWKLPVMAPLALSTQLSQLLMPLASPFSTFLYIHTSQLGSSNSIYVPASDLHTCQTWQLSWNEDWQKLNSSYFAFSLIRFSFACIHRMSRHRVDRREFCNLGNRRTLSVVGLCKIMWRAKITWNVQIRL